MVGRASETGVGWTVMETGLKWKSPVTVLGRGLDLLQGDVNGSNVEDENEVP